VSVFRRAIVRPPASTFAAGLTTAELGAPDLDLALEQHEGYCAALVEVGLELVRLEPDPAFPDSTFVEDTAVLTSRFAVLTRPGAESRAGEVASMAECVARFYERIERIEAPGTLDGGDVCEAGDHFFIGVSHRTNEAGARQLARWLADEGCTSALVDIRATGGILHLKSGLAHAGGRDLVVIDALAEHPAFRDWRRLPVARAEEYAANCVHLNGRVVLPAGFPRLAKTLEAAGHRTLPVAMSEFQKQDGGPSCLSLRF